MLAFARTHKVALWALFSIAALSVVALSVINNFRPSYTKESWGWMIFFGALPWSIVATVVPGWIGIPVMAIGLGVNVAATSTAVWYAISWWLKTLRNSN